MGFIDLVVGAVVAWGIPKLLDRILAKGRLGAEEGFPWVRWCLFQGLAGGVGGFLSGALGALGLETPGGVGNWTVFGVAIGIGQWAALRRYLDVGPSWAVFSALGWSVWSVFQVARVSPFLGWAVAGLCVGSLQWLMLARVRTGALWWIPANGAGWLVGGSLGWVIGIAMVGSGVPLPVAWVVGWAAVAAIGSVALGAALSRMGPKEEAGSR